MCPAASFFIFFFNDTATTEIYTLSLHDALPISSQSSTHSRPCTGAADPERRDDNLLHEPPGIRGARDPHGCVGRRHDHELERGNDREVLAGEPAREEARAAR